VSGWVIKLAPLTERPGSWARVQLCDSRKKAGSLASYLRKLRRLNQLPAGEWQFVIRSLGDGAAGVWACFTAAADES
jgi:hypothetical protein